MNQDYPAIINASRSGEEEEDFTFFEHHILPKYF
jgi:hypothetical protein